MSSLIMADHAWGRWNFSLFIMLITEVMLNRKKKKIKKKNQYSTYKYRGQCIVVTGWLLQWQHKLRLPLLFQTPRLNIKIQSLSNKSFFQWWFLSSHADPITLMRVQVFALFIFILSNMSDSCTQRRRPCKPGNRYCSSISWFSSPGRICWLHLKSWKWQPSPCGTEISSGLKCSLLGSGCFNRKELTYGPKI